jgi:hypothetical protein
MHDCYSVTYPNGSPLHAWRAGFREGVKLCTRDGIPPPSANQLLEHAWPRNLQNLGIWQTIGVDIEYGQWAIHGARCGTYYLLLESNWDYTGVRDFDYLNKLWEKHAGDDSHISREIMLALNKHCGLNLVELDSEQSKFFKKHIQSSWRNRGPMIKEIDVIREEEGW